MFDAQETRFLHELVQRVLHRFLIDGEPPGTLYHELPPERFHKEVREKVILLQGIGEKLWRHSLSF
jgi:hypothetical protein